MAKTGAPDLVRDLARALRETEDLPPWDVQWRNKLITPEQYTDFVMRTARAPSGTRWRLEALLRILHAVECDDSLQQYRKQLKHDIEDEHRVLERDGSRYHVCDPSRCDCVPPRRRTPFNPRS